MEDDPEAVEAPLLAGVAGGNGNYAWLSRSSVKWAVLVLLTAIIMAAIGWFTVGTFDYTVWCNTIANLDANGWRATGFAFAGDLTTLFLIYSPLDTFLDIAGVGNVGDRIHIPNVAAVINCGVWSWYGALLSTVNYSVLLTNLTGAAFHVGYLWVYFKCCRGRRTFFFIWVGLGVGLAAAIAGTCFYLQSTGSDLSHVVGMSGLITGLLMYFGTSGENMMVAHRTNGEEGLTGLVATAMNTTLWTSYAVIINDTSMLVPNGVGVFLCVLQAIQRTVYHFLMPAGELGAWVMGAWNAMVAKVKLAAAHGGIGPVVAHNEGNDAAAATADNNTAAAASDNNTAAGASDDNGGQP